LRRQRGFGLGSRARLDGSAPLLAVAASVAASVAAVAASVAACGGCRLRAAVSVTFRFPPVDPLLEPALHARRFLGFVAERGHSRRRRGGAHRSPPCSCPLLHPAAR